MSFEPESSSSTSSSTPGWTYDVFLSFRGEDTRRNFTDHLYNALKQAGIYTFRDDNELPRGEEISQSLLKAIQESRISIVVFSKGYASSRWCLDELVEILESRHACKGQFVLPIFYHIDPSDVRKQSGSYMEAFDRHEERSKEKVQKWREALKEAGNLSGWNLKDMVDGHESKFIQKIIEDVLNKLHCKLMNVAEHLVGIDSRVGDVISLLRIDMNDVRIVGIHGMAGIGKTTVAKAVFNRLLHEFEGSCFLLEVKERSEKPGYLIQLQKQLLCDILKPKKWKINDVDRGINSIKERLRHKRVLLVLDDVDQLEQVHALVGGRRVGEPRWFGPGSRIIITTKDECLLTQIDADMKYQARGLCECESLQLFTWHAFRDTHPNEDDRKLSNTVVQYTEGLPLALEVLGSYLCKRSIPEWESAIKKLQEIPDGQIQKKLRISYDTLDDKVQGIFLDIACFFIGCDKERVATILDGRGFYSEIDIMILIERSLLRIDWGNRLRMHNLLRDMGREIIRGTSPENPGKRSRIWLTKDALDVLNKKMGTEIVEGLALDVRSSTTVPLTTESFAKMRFLKLLQINGANLTGSYEHLSKELTWLCWHKCPLTTVPSNFQLDNLVVLDMQYSCVKELWKETRVLNKLKILDLSYSQYLTKTPNFQSLSLEKLMLEGCLSLVEVHQSIGGLESLGFLNLKGCCKLKNLPQSIGCLKSLKTLDISLCSQLEKLPESMGDMESLAELRADGIGNEQFFSSVGQLKNVRKLSLRGCSSDQDSPTPTSWVSPISSRLFPRSLNWKALLPTSLAGWGLLRKLTLPSFCEGATNGVDFGSLYSLEELDLSWNKFLNLPSGIGCLPKLQVLEVSYCQNLLSILELPSSLVQLGSDGCTSLERVILPFQLAEFLSVYLRSCPNVEVEGFNGLSGGACCITGISDGILEAISNFDFKYDVYSSTAEIPDWFSYRGEESSLPFNLPPFFQGLALWMSLGFVILPEASNLWVIIKNKSNGIQLLKRRLTRIPVDSYMSWVCYVRRKDFAMKDYCGEELELYLEIGNENEDGYLQIRPEYRSSFKMIREIEDSELESKELVPGLIIKEIGVHMIVEKLDSYEESESQSEWDHDIDNLQGTKSSADDEEGEEIDSQTETDKVIPKLYHHRLHNPLLGSIAFSTKEQWKSYLRMELPEWDKCWPLSVTLWHGLT